MKPTFASALFLCAVLLTNCAPGDSSSGSKKITAETLCSSWRLAHFEVVQEENENLPAEEKLIREALNAGMVEAGVLYAFFPDGTMTEMTGQRYQSGQWKLEKGGREIKLTYDGNSSPAELRVKDLDEQFLTVLAEQDGMQSKLQLRRENGQPKDPKADPFHPENNQWRKKATAKESDEQLKARLKNLVRHYIYILQKADDTKAEVVTFGHSMSVIKIYNGGIGPVPEERLPKEWKETFYDEEDALRACQLFKDWLVKTPGFGGASTGSWIKDDLVILKAMYGTEW
jgi:hypothetical protein